MRTENPLNLVAVVLARGPEFNAGDAQTLTRVGELQFEAFNL